MIDAYRRKYKFAISIGGHPLLECNKIGGIKATRKIIEHATATGDTIPLVGPKEITHLEISEMGGPADYEWFDLWYQGMLPDPLTGSIRIYTQAGVVGQKVSFINMIPEEMGVDDLDRKAAEEHGMTYKVACNLLSLG